MSQKGFERTNYAPTFIKESTTLRNWHFGGGISRVSTRLGSFSGLLPALDFLQRSIASGLTDLRTLIALNLDLFQWGTLNGLRCRRHLSAVTTALRLLLDALLMQSAVQLGPRMLRRLALHVEGGFRFGVQKDIGSAIRADVSAAMPGVDTEP